ncbi:MAG TPA: serine/threonine-protein kinase [Kofleriaceae bacterium]|nr:serine/threonine-protein kinase [Kofleriaceae bacterium]
MLPWGVGDVVGGQYTIRKQLGLGGMSSVWDAYDQLMQRPVALKTSLDRATSAMLVTHEARALAAVRHPGLPVPLTVGCHDRWTFLALERLFGVTIEDRLESPGPGKQAFPIAEAVRILIAIADVLVAVHAAGMAHHDVKPGNVMLCAGERVVLLDFGIMLPEVIAADADVSGTPRYLAPEVVLEALQPGQARLVDIYAFGVMAFEMLAGKPPFHSTDFDVLMNLHAYEPVPDLLSQRGDVPVALADLVDACLAKSPSDRPSTIDQVLWELRAVEVRARRRRSTTL